MPNRINHLAAVVATAMLATTLASCNNNNVPPFFRQFTPYEITVPTSSIRVFDPTQTIKLDSTINAAPGSVAADTPAAGAFVLTLPPNALSALLTKPGAVTMVVTQPKFASLQNTTQQAIQADITQSGVGLVGTMQVDLAGGGVTALKTASLHTQQLGGTPVALTFRLPLGTRCQDVTCQLRQVITNDQIPDDQPNHIQVIPLTSNLTADNGTPQRVSGTATIFLNTPRIILYLLCLAPGT